MKKDFNTYFGNHNFINVLGWMVVELKLSGSELLIYALIYGYSQAQEYAKCHLSFFAGAANITKANAKKVVDRLLEKGYIQRRNALDDIGNSCHEYRATPSVYLKIFEVCYQNDNRGCYQNNNAGVAETDTHIIKSNINNKIYNKDNSSDCGGTLFTESRQSSLNEEKSLFGRERESAARAESEEEMVERKTREFKDACEKYVPKFGRDTVDEFFNYYAQVGDRGLLLWEIKKKKEGAFDLGRRIATWDRNNKKWQGNKPQPQPQPVQHPQRKKKTMWEQMGLTYEEYIGLHKND